MTCDIVSVEGLVVERNDGAVVVDQATFGVRPGTVLGVVGESGCGKTTMGLAMLGFARPGMRLAAGSVNVDGHEMLETRDSAVRRLRGEVVSYVPQDPAAALNPALRIETQIANVIRSHRTAAHDSVHDILSRVQLPTTNEFRRRYPHELSGGQQQRVALALALVCRPKLTILDEPTTGLDVVVQARLLDEINVIRRERGTALLYVTHDLAVVASIADRVAVMYAGRIVEMGPADALLRDPHHPYTRGLISSMPSHREPRRPIGIPGMVPPPLIGGHLGCGFVARCAQTVPTCHDVTPRLEPVTDDRSVRCPEWRRTPPVATVPRSLDSRRRAAALLTVRDLIATHTTRNESVVAAAGVSFDLSAGECLALVGESGSGKTTIARCVVGLHPPAGGAIELDGRALAGSARERTRAERRRLQIVFQNPRLSFNPRQTVVDEIARPAVVLRQLSSEDATREAVDMLGRVRLPPWLGQRFPGELSGGELQRAAIARALIARPDVVICDEVTSALDVSVQAAVLELLTELRLEFGLSLLFITHDLGLVASIADRVMVLNHGLIAEHGSVADVLRKPESEYTKTLLEAAP